MKIYTCNKSQTGSTLIGVALLTLVMGFLMSGGIYLLNTYDAVQTNIETSEKTADLQKALKNFVGIYKRYPCPAPINVAPDEPGFGIENCGASSGIADVSGRDGLGVKIGTVPVRTLNVPDSLIVDGFGRRHIYAVTTEMTNPATADVVNGLGAITIMHEANGHKETLSNHEGHVVYLLMSPGSDDRGAYDINGKEILPCEHGTIAGRNCDMANATFYTTVKSSVGDSTDFTHNFAFAANSPSYYWYTGQWSECANKYRSASITNQQEWNGSASFFNNNAAKPECFSSFQERQVVCRDKQGNDVAASYCNHTDEPIDYRTCAIDKCEWGVALPSCSSRPIECGSYEEDYVHTCFDYKDINTSVSNCAKYEGTLMPTRPPLPTTQCGYRCCTETHSIDGVVQNHLTEIKREGTCESTDRPSTCEERGDCAPDPDPVDPVTDPTCGTPPSPETRTNDLGCAPGQEGANMEQERRTASFNASCGVVWSAWSKTGNDINTCRAPGEPEPEPTCTYSRVAVDSKNEVTNCPSGQQGQISKWYEKFETRQTDCSTSVSDWELVQTDGSCKTCTTVRGAPTTTITLNHDPDCRNSQTGGCGSWPSLKSTSETDFKVIKVYEWNKESCGPGASSTLCRRTETTTYAQVQECN